MDLYKNKIKLNRMKKVLTGEFESSKKNLRRDINKSLLSRLIKKVRKRK
jgi:hypothetical protein